MNPRNWAFDADDPRPEWSVPKLRAPRYSQSLERGLAILGCFSPDRSILGIADIADELGMSRSTTHRYVITLVALGYLKQGEARKYRLGLRVIDIGMSALNGAGLCESAHPYLESLAKHTHYTCSVGVLDGTEIAYVDRVRTHRRGYSKSILFIGSGSRLPAAVTAMGKLLLANLPDPERATRLTEIKLKKLGPNTILTKSRLRAEFIAIGELGLAAEAEELESGFCSVAAAIRDESREVVAAIEIAAPRTAIGLRELVSFLGRTCARPRTTYPPGWATAWTAPRTARTRMSDMPPSVIEHLRVALLNEIRTLAETLHSISDAIDSEFAHPSPNLQPPQNRFVDLSATIQTTTRLHARIGSPGEPLSPSMLTFRDSEERDLALEILNTYRDQLFRRLITNQVESDEKEQAMDALRLLTDFLHVSNIDPESTIELPRAHGER